LEDPDYVAHIEEQVLGDVEQEAPCTEAKAAAVFAAY
jgi:hypothetical protein